MAATDIDYLGLLKKSWKDFLNNKILFLPVVLAIIVIPLIVLAVLAVEGLILALVFGTASFDLIIAGLATGFGIGLAVVFGILDLIIFALIISYFSSIFVSMYREIIDTGRTSAQFLHKRGLKFMKKIFWIGVYKFLIVFLVPLIFAGIGMIFLRTVLPVSIFIFVLSGLFVVVLSIIMYFGTFFASPIITVEKGTSWQVFLKILDYSKKNLAKVLLTWLVSLLLIVVVGIAMFIITFPISILSTVLNSFNLIYLGLPLSFVGSLLQTIVRIIMNFVLGLFMFNVFFNAEKKLVKKVVKEKAKPAKKKVKKNVKRKKKRK
jgi:hypothetical protein